MPSYPCVIAYIMTREFIFFLFFNHCFAHYFVIKVEMKYCVLMGDSKIDLLLSPSFIHMY